MSFTLPALPYANDALAPHISAETISFHYGKHHNAYVVKLNELIAGTEHEKQSLEEIIIASSGKPEKAAIFNNAAQIWNHTFYWHSMKQAGGGAPSGVVSEKIKADFGSVEEFNKQFTAAGAAQFGSGWAWLVLSNEKLEIVKTPNAETPITQGKTPLLTMDVWEHAYYIDYQNRRPDYMNVFLSSLVNWDFANRNLEAAQAKKAA